MKRSTQSASKPRPANLIQMGLALALVCLAFGLGWNTRRADLLTRQEKAEQYAGSLDAGHSVGQTFIARQDGLNALQFFLRAAPGAQDAGYKLTLHLKTTPDAPGDLRTLRLALNTLESGSRLTFAFAPLASAGTAFYALIETDAPANQITLLSSRTDAYFDGSLYLDGKPTDRDLAFRAYTAPEIANLLSTVPETGARLGWMLLFSLFFSLLGGSLLVILDIQPSIWAEWLITALALGVCVCPLLWTAAAALPVRLEPPVIRAGFVALVTLAALKLGLQRSAIFQRFTNKRAMPGEKKAGELAGNNTPTVKSPYHSLEIALGALFILALLTAAVQIQGLAAPLWVDGLTHADTIQKIMQAGGLPDGLIYHVGFHTNTAALQAFTHIAVPELMLVYGQWVSVVGGLTLYLFVRTVIAPCLPESKSGSLLALFSAAAFWFFAQSPAYLVNWGRYPFMQGLALLPAALAWAAPALAGWPERRLGRLILAALLAGGAFLSHYGMLFFGLTFLLSWAVWSAWQAGYLTPPSRLRLLLPAVRFDWRLGLTGLVISVGLVVLFGRISGLWLDGTLARIIEQSRQNVQDLDLAQILRLNFQAGGVWLGLTGAAGLVYAAWRARPALIVLGGWFISQAALIALQAPFLGEALASYTNLLLAVSLPLAVFAGLFGCFLAAAPAAAKQLKKQVAQRSNRPLHEPIRREIWAVLTILVVLGAYAKLQIITPSTALFGPADQKAMQWIREKTPAAAQFLVNSNYWGSSKQAIVPSDGGGWLAQMTGRQAHFIQSETERQNLSSYLQSHQITYLYLGAFPGFLDLGIRSDQLQPDSLENVYQNDNIIIYRYRAPALP